MRNETYSLRVAANTRAIMARLDRSQRWLSQQVNIPPATLHTKLRGRSPFYAHEIVAIAAALGVTDLNDILPPLAEEAA